MSDEEQLPKDLLSKLGEIIIRDVPPVTRVKTFCNVCEHEITRHGNGWRCVEDPPCRCLMIGCVLKRWDIPDDD